jgi:parallel beta-helix repeat protein
MMSADRRLVGCFCALLLFLGLAAGCSDDDGDTDAAVDDAGTDGDVDSGPVCVPFVEGMEVVADITLCEGTTQVSPPVGEAAMYINADGVTVTCLGTEIVGDNTRNTKGIWFYGRTDVTVRGCAVHGFGYGLVAGDATNIVLEQMNLDDNFTSPDATWVQDSVQGGGIRLQGVNGGRVSDSSFARNWNGIELRSTRNVVVSANSAHHCTNVGALLVDAHDNEISNNDMSFAVRGDNLVYPTRWYGQDTRDSAGIIIDAGSTGNLILSNDLTFGGDGVFIRTVIGPCARDNRVEGNDTSFSPNNAIECWCDGNIFEDNIASDSNYGIWTGAMDRGVIRGNIVEQNEVDGISIQCGEHRHGVIEDNYIAHNGRVGLLLSGREYQSWHTLNNWADFLANSSHIVVQRNTFENNFRWDIFSTSTRSVVMASNCGDGGGAPAVNAGAETDVFVTVGTCGGAVGRTPPTAVLARPPPAELGVPLILDASGSQPAQAGDTLTYTWLVQPSALRFPSLTMPTMVFSGDATETPSVTFTEPGLYDVDLTVSDGYLASMDWHVIAVPPTGVRVGETPADWTYSCDQAPDCVTVISADSDGVHGDAVHIVTDAPFDFTALAPASRNLGLDASGMTGLSFYVRSFNLNTLGFQGNYPVVVLASFAGTITYTPDVNLLQTLPDDWYYLDVPLAGGSGWTRTDAGGSLSLVDWIEIHTDTWGGDPYQIWIDAVTFY